MATTGSVHGSVLRGLLHAAVTGDGDAMGDLVTEDVIGWSPNLLVRSRAELLDAIGRGAPSRRRPDVDDIAAVDGHSSPTGTWSWSL